ncbi:molybdopterin biosynthesis protein [Rhodobaculum claviforme]|uniref:Molybdopterin biosynthesis protein n=1 Tax=Rhodobaculum claviforme TaxID=1549854 RepID=A0A934TKU5_9RHOB|nr:molybdopterin biosynthesis protein [Rhodobaculum claviforme]MBK5927667.1 molybdopterin biosynthesis protein [Rhodobaculum claviforme]
MRFGPVPLAQAEGAILAHSLHAGAVRLRKGQVLGPAALAQLAAAGVGQVVVARPDPGDVPEDAAAASLAAALVPDEGAACLVRAAPFTGRANLHAGAAGLALIERASVDALNAVDPAITLATLAPFTRVAPGVLVATVKVIPYAVPGPALAAACARACDAVRVAPFVRRTAGLVMTRVPGQPARLNDKGAAAAAARLAGLGMRLAAVEEVAHDTAALAGALGRLPGEVALILTGSATADVADTGPAAVAAAGGRITRFGLPVDPGNLLFLGDLGGRPVVGLPGSARSPVPHGADWVLERVACGLAVGAAEVAAMGVGGLLKEIPTRPHPRERRR